MKVENTETLLVETLWLFFRKAWSIAHYIVLTSWLLNLVSLLVPCLRRVVSVEEEYDAARAEVVLDDDEGGWLATHGVQGSSLNANAALSTLWITWAKSFLFSVGNV